MQQHTDSSGLPTYSAARLRAEARLFTDWLLDKHLGIVLSPAQRAMFADIEELLVASALSQPQTFVHRDYHSRNLIVTPVKNPGILDFQDAVVGPLTYDLVSLLKDCYIAWPAERVQRWCDDYQFKARRAGLLNEVDRDRVRYWFDLMGIQRHLKAAGIFTRLYHRDGKDGYLKEIPRTLDHITAATKPYPELVGLREFLCSVVKPKLAEHPIR